MESPIGIVLSDGALSRVWTRAQPNGWGAVARVGPTGPAICPSQPMRAKDRERVCKRDHTVGNPIGIGTSVAGDHGLQTATRWTRGGEGAGGKEAYSIGQRTQVALWPPNQPTRKLSSRDVVQSNGPCARRASGKPSHWRVLECGGTQDTRQQQLFPRAEGARVTRLPSPPSHGPSLAPPPVSQGHRRGWKGV